MGERRAYVLSFGFVLRLLATAAVFGRRDLGRDGLCEASRWRLRPRVVGAERIPERGAFIVVMNHYERPGIRVWWAVMFVSAVIWRRRRQDPPVRWLATDRLYRFRVAGVLLPDRLVRWLIRLVSHEYGFIAVHREEAGPRAPALREAYAVLRGRRGRPPAPIGVTPEAASGGGPVVGPAWPNSGMALAWLSRGETPLLPVAVYEDGDGRLTAHFGQPFALEWPGLRRARAMRDELTARVMVAVATLLPPELRGVYADRTAAP